MWCGEETTTLEFRLRPDQSRPRTGRGSSTAVLDPLSFCRCRPWARMYDGSVLRFPISFERLRKKAGEPHAHTEASSGERAMRRDGMGGAGG